MAKSDLTFEAIRMKLLGTTLSTEWEFVNRIPLNFKTYHPQGLVKMGKRYFLSTVHIPKNESGELNRCGIGRGYLVEFDKNGEKKNEIELCDAYVYHSGGIDTDGRVIYVPVSEYRKESTCHIYKFNLETFGIEGEVFRFPDHIGAIAVDTETNRIYGMSWAGRKIYVWDYKWNLLYVNSNPVENVHYQDVKHLGGDILICAGFSWHQVGCEKIGVGGMDMIDANTCLPTHRIMVTTKTHTGRLLVKNAFYWEIEFPDLYLYFVPDDDENSHLEIYKI